jgi:hypothetical protein
MSGQKDRATLALDQLVKDVRNKYVMPPLEDI